MISADRDVGLRGKGKAAENERVAHAPPFGRDEKIGATVTDEMISVLRYWICLTQVTVFDSAVALFFWFFVGAPTENKYISKRGFLLWKERFGRFYLPLSLSFWRY